MTETLALRIMDGLPATLRRVGDDLSEQELRFRPAPGEWSIVEQIGHLLDKTESWGERFHRMATEDSPRLAAFDQDEYVRERSYQDRNANELVRQLTSLLSTVTAELRALPAEAWERHGVHAERGVLKLREAVRIYAVSLSDHTQQLVHTRDAALSLSGRPPGGPSGL